MVHAYDVDDAKRYGILAAVLLQNITFWVAKNRANGINYHDGKWWTYNSVSAFCELFPEASKKEIRTALERLRKDGAIVAGNFNEDKRDRQLWYTVPSVCDGPCDGGQMHLPVGANGVAPEGTSYICTDINPDINEKEDSLSESGRKTFEKPTVDEVRAYCQARGNDVDPEGFWNFYESKGWMVGKNHMKNWKASVVTWERKKAADRPRTVADKVDLSAYGRGI